jgi:ABC-2 type transport system ATP-binding protein
MEDVTDIASRVLVLDDGRVVFDGTVHQLSDRAPGGASPGRAAEAGFLQVIADARDTRL